MGKNRFWFLPILKLEDNCVMFCPQAYIVTEVLDSLHGIHQQ